MKILLIFSISFVFSTCTTRRESVQKLFDRASDSFNINSKRFYKELDKGSEANQVLMGKYAGKANGWYEVEMIMYDSLKKMK